MPVLRRSPLPKAHEGHVVAPRRVEPRERNAIRRCGFPEIGSAIIAALHRTSRGEACLTVAVTSDPGISPTRAAARPD